MAFALLSGCTTAPSRVVPPDPDIAWQRHHERIIRIDAWDLDGRMSIRTEEQGGRVGISWRQDQGRYDMRLSGQFGQGVVEISGSPRRVRLTLPNGEVVEERSAETLLRRQFGWEVPVGTLRYWVLGVPSPGTEEVHELDELGRLARLEQAGWRIEFKDYTRVEELDLPRKLFLSGKGLEVRLVIDEWRDLAV
jgi:outer membrane lipoprotein LolB